MSFTEKVLSYKELNIFGRAIVLGTSDYWNPSTKSILPYHDFNKLDKTERNKVWRFLTKSTCDVLKEIWHIHTIEGHLPDNLYLSAGLQSAWARSDSIHYPLSPSNHYP